MYKNNTAEQKQHSSLKQALELAQSGLVEKSHSLLRAEQRNLSELSEKIQIHRLQLIQNIFKRYPVASDSARPDIRQTDELVGAMVTGQEKNGISLVTCCMNRNDNLHNSLLSWLKFTEINEIVIIDWSSADPVYAFLKHYDLLDPRIVIARVNHQNRWILSKAYNLGFRLTNYNKILKLDCDIILSDNFFQKNTLRKNYFLAGNHRQVPSRDQIYINGAFFVHKSDLAAINGFNEYITTYGWEDDDLYERMTELCLVRQDFDSKTLSHILHPDYSRIGPRVTDVTCAYDFFKQDTQCLTIRNRYIARSMPMWGEKHILQSFYVISRGKGYLEIEQSDQKKNPIPEHIISDADYYSKLDILHRRRNISAHHLSKQKSHILFQKRQFQDISEIDVFLLSLEDTDDITWRKHSLIVRIPCDLPHKNQQALWSWLAQLSISATCTVFIEGKQNLPHHIQNFYGADIRFFPGESCTLDLPGILFNELSNLEKKFSLQNTYKLILDKDALKQFVADAFIRHNTDFRRKKSIKPDIPPKRNSDGFFQIEITGKKISIPYGFLSQDKFSAELEKVNTSVLPFMATRVFAEHPLFIEDFSHDHSCSLMLALLYINKPVIAICHSEGELQFMREICLDNGISNLYAFFYEPKSPLSYINRHFLNRFFRNRAIVFNECVFICRNFHQGPLYKFAQHLQKDNMHISVYSEDESVPDHAFSCFDTGPSNLFFSTPDQSWCASTFRHGHINNRKPGLDIVVAMYNTPNYIIPCIDSLICADRDDINILVINDGSTDNSAEIVESHYAYEPRVKLITKHNGGCASARNYGRILSNSSHVTFVDADDFTDPDFFAHLYDLAVYTGCEMVQGGFDFYDEGKTPQYTTSYEDDTFKDYPGKIFQGQKAIQVQGSLLIYGQPTIWRRVYRRDFLDAKNLFFPENIRAFDDYIFHLLTLYYARDFYMLPDIKLHYRQHPNQDIKQGDERHFYEIYMFKLTLRRAVEEGWPDFYIFVRSMFNSINWSLNSLRPDLVQPFADAAAEFCIVLEKVLGANIFNDCPVSVIENSRFHNAYKQKQKLYAKAGDSYIWAYIENIGNHPAMLQMAEAMKEK